MRRVLLAVVLAVVASGLVNVPARASTVADVGSATVTTVIGSLPALATPAQKTAAAAITTAAQFDVASPAVQVLYDTPVTEVSEVDWGYEGTTPDPGTAFVATGPRDRAGLHQRVGLEVGSSQRLLGSQQLR
jgi:hypothetical protein